MIIQIKIFDENSHKLFIKHFIINHIQSCMCSDININHMYQFINLCCIVKTFQINKLRLSFLLSAYCNWTFDSILCWPPTKAGDIALQRCPAAKGIDTTSEYIIIFFGINQIDHV